MSCMGFAGSGATLTRAPERALLNPSRRPGDPIPKSCAT